MPIVTEVCPSTDLLNVIRRNGPSAAECYAAGTKTLLGFKTILASEMNTRLANADTRTIAAVLLFLRGDAEIV